MDLQNYRSALVELLTLKDLAPDESKIHFALGNIYKRLRDKANAIKHFTIALNLDPKVLVAHFVSFTIGLFPY